jgi:hypothetical protein
METCDLALVLLEPSIQLLAVSSKRTVSNLYLFRMVKL